MEDDIDPLALEIVDELSEDLSSKSGTWENENLAQVKYKVLRGHREAINSCQFCSNDALILTGSSDQTSALWDVNTGEKLQKFDGHDNVISQCHMNSDTTTFISGSWDKTCKLWDVETGQTLWSGRHHGIVTCCQISHSGKLVAVGSDLENALTIWDKGSGEMVKKVKDHHKSTVSSLKFSPNDDRICTTSMDGSTKMWDLHSQRVTVQVGGHINVISSCCFDKEERNLCTGSWDKCLQIWDISCGTFRTQGPTTLCKGHEGCISSCVFSNDGGMLASGSYDCTVVVWDMETLSSKLTLKGHEDWVTGVDFSQDSKTVLSCSKDKTLRVWNVSESDTIPVVLESKRSMGLRIVKVSLQMDGGHEKKLDIPLKAFDTTANQLCQSFKDKTFSRTRFIEEFNRQSSKLSPSNHTVHNSTNTQDGSSTSLGASFTSDSENQDCSPPTLHTFKVADSFKVKVDLLNAPSLINQVRGVDEEHSKKLQKEMEKNPDCQYFKLLVHIPGVLAAEVVHDKINSGDYRLEVIGGNHTRIALQRMKEVSKEFVDATIYAGLNPIQALSLGLKHNETHNHAKAMGFQDYVHLFRKMWCNTVTDLEYPTMKERTQMNSNLANMLRLSKLEVSRKFRHHLYLSTLPPNIWDKATRFMNMWQLGEIPGQPKKPLTQFTMMTLEKVDKSEFADIIDKLCEKEQTWSQVRHSAVKKSNKSSSVSEELKGITEELRQVKTERDKLKRKVEELEREVTALKSQRLPQQECKECGKPFSISQLDDSSGLHMCVFCRLQASRNIPSFKDDNLMELPR